MYFVQVTSTDDDAVVPRAVMTLVESVTFRSLSSGTVYSFSVTAIGIEGQRSEPGQAVSQTVCEFTLNVEKQNICRHNMQFGCFLCGFMMHSWSNGFR